MPETWQNRITRALVRQRDLWARWTTRWTVIRTSNAYTFRAPQPQLAGVPASECKNPSGTQNREANPTLRAPEVRQAAQLVLNTVRLRRMQALA